MRLVAESSGQAAVARFEGLETAAKTGGLVAAQGRYRSIIALIVELTNGVRRHYRHAILLTCSRCRLQFAGAHQMCFQS
jgi:hypothetical protein